MRSFHFNENSLFFMDFANFCDSQIICVENKATTTNSVLVFLEVFFISMWGTNTRISKQQFTEKSVHKFSNRFVFSLYCIEVNRNVDGGSGGGDNGALNPEYFLICSKQILITFHINGMYRTLDIVRFFIFSTFTHRQTERHMRRAMLFKHVHLWNWSAIRLNYNLKVVIISWLLN